MSYIWFLVMVFILASCQTNHELKFDEDQKSKKPHIDWNDLLTKKKHKLKIHAKSYIDHGKRSKRYREVPETIRRQPVLAKLAIDHFVSDPEPIDKGVYGRVGDVTKFVALKKDIKDSNRLYWAQVKTLSEKYGCFIRSRWKKANIMGFQCRDKRTVVQWRYEGDDYIGFLSKQYDKNGRPIIVRNHEVVKKGAFKKHVSRGSFQESDFLR